MALYNEINTGRLNRFLQKFLSMKGGPPAAQLAGDIATSISLFNGCENRFLEGWNRFAIQQSQPATVGQQSAIRIRNPVTSGVIAVFEMITLSNQNAAGVQNHACQIGPSTTDYGTAITPTLASLDARQVNLTPLIMSRSGAGAITSVGFSIFTVMLGTFANYDAIITEDQQIPLLPGWALQPLTANANEVLNVSLRWRERPLEDSEKF